MPTAGLKTIIALSFVLAVGFLLVILSCALWHSYYPLLVVATYVLAPVPNWICSHCANPDDFVESSGAAVLDLGRFCTGFLVVMGVGTFFSLSERKVLERKGLLMLVLNSVARSARALGSHLHLGHDHVCYWRAAHLRDHHQLCHVLPRRAGVLELGGTLGNGNGDVGYEA
jgi:hypothetical protein